MEKERPEMKSDEENLEFWLIRLLEGMLHLEVTLKAMQDGEHPKDHNGWELIKRGFSSDHYLVDIWLSPSHQSYVVSTPRRYTKGKRWSAGRFSLEQAENLYDRKLRERLSCQLTPVIRGEYKHIK
jgi:hypothetical protein